MINADGKEVRTVELDAERAPLVKWAFEAYATGNWTLKKLLAELERRGLTNAPIPKFPKRPLRLSHLHTLLRHPYYKGMVVWRGVEYEGRHPKLVDEQTWNEVQRVLTAKAKGEKAIEHDHYLKSTVYCGECGSRLIVSKNRNRQGVIYPYFVCAGRHEKRTDCYFKATLISSVEDAIEDFYQQVVLPEDVRDDIEQIISEEMAAMSRHAEIERRDYQVQRQRLTAQRKKLLEAHYAGAIPLELLKEEQDRITNQPGSIQIKIEAAEDKMGEVALNMKKALDFASDCHRAYLAAPASVRRD